MITVIIKRRIPSIEVRIFNKYEFSRIIVLCKEYKCREEIYYLTNRRVIG